MEYERIRKVQNGIISPSKLRIKLIGPHHQRKMNGSNSNSARTSPSKHGDSEFVKNSLLSLDDEAPGLDVTSIKLPSELGLGSESVQGDSASMHAKDLLPRENVNLSLHHLFSRPDMSDSSTIHPVNNLEDENHEILDYESNAKSSNFEFHKAERSLCNATMGLISRPMPSKWNNAEKWLMNRHMGQSNSGSKEPCAVQGQVNWFPATNMDRVAPECAGHLAQPSLQMGMMEKFSFVPHCPVDAMTGFCLQTKNLKDVNHTETLCSILKPEDSIAPFPAIRSVAMRDMGTEMTPIPSQEPSMTTTPVGATTPIRSATSSIPSTPRGRVPASTPVEHAIGDRPMEAGRMEMSEKELKEKTRKEIVALGVQLGKMNIAAWASKDEQEHNPASVIENSIDEVENEQRAAAWEEAEKAKHLARYRREEIRIQAWESQQRAKLEAKIRRVEAQVDGMRAQSHAKASDKLAMARKRSEEKRAAALARRNHQAERTAAQAEYIRQTGRIPSASVICCGCLG